MGIAVFRKQPTSKQVQAFLARRSGKRGQARSTSSATRAAVLVQGVQTLVPTTQDPAAIRGRRPVRQHRRHRAVHPDAEGRRPPTRFSFPLNLRSMREEVTPHSRLVQHLSAAHVPGRPHARGTLPANSSRLPTAAIRAPAALADRFALRCSRSQASGSARCTVAARGRLSPRSEAPAGRQPEAGGVVNPRAVPGSGTRLRQSWQAGLSPAKSSASHLDTRVSAAKHPLTPPATTVASTEGKAHEGRWTRTGGVRGATR